MRTELILNPESTNKSWAAWDASLRNAVNSSLYTTQDRARAEGIRYALELVYSGRASYISYGKRGITVKIEGAEVQDPKRLAFLEQEWTTQKIKKRISSQGVIYNIPRN